MKIITVLGARPQFIKAAAMSREFKKNNLIEEVIIHTGQHFDKNMSEIFFKDLSIPAPNYNLAISGGNHGNMTGEMIKQIEVVLINEKPDYVLVYGDTNSTLAGAIAAKKLNIKLVHVESGLRSFNNKMPEEINRVLTDRVSDILFCPTEKSIRNLEAEGFNNFNCKIVKSGDVMKDVALFYSERLKSIKNPYEKFDLPENYILATCHRAENTDIENKICSIMKALDSLNDNIRVVMPLHPRTKNKLAEFKIKSNIHFIDPVGYLDMINLIFNSGLVITDSGGLQKEAYFFKKYCLTIRSESEWVELQRNKFNFIVGSDEKKIINYSKKYFGQQIKNEVQLYGDGKASKLICKALIDNYMS